MVYVIHHPHAHHPHAHPPHNNNKKHTTPHTKHTPPGTTGGIDWVVEERPLHAITCLTKHKLPTLTPERILQKGDVTAIDSAIRALHTMQEQVAEQGVLQTVDPLTDLKMQRNVAIRDQLEHCSGVLKQLNYLHCMRCVCCVYMSALVPVWVCHAYTFTITTL